MTDETAAPAEYDFFTRAVFINGSRRYLESAGKRYRHGATEEAIFQCRHASTVDEMATKMHRVFSEYEIHAKVGEA